jgi:hypothetical protein
MSDNEYTKSCEYYTKGWGGKWGLFHYFLFISILSLVLSLIIKLTISIANRDGLAIFGSFISIFISLWFNKFFWNFFAPKSYHQVLCSSDFINKYVPKSMYGRLFVKPVITL